MTLPDQYKWLTEEPVPPILVAALKYFGLKEAPGGEDNPVILEWAKGFGITWYTHDSIAWCSLAMAKWASIANYKPPVYTKVLAAVSWADWEEEVPVGQEQTGDVAVFHRPGGHHVCLIVGKDSAAYHGYGGNTRDAVGIARMAKERLLTIRRPRGVPATYGIKLYNANGELSQNEA